MLIRREAAQLEPSVSIQSQVKTYLTDTGRKKKWLASRLGVSPTTLSQWLAGKSAFSDQRLHELLDIIQSNV
ncbi:XRE family transcriptional regulator [Clostridiaceae bacterium]|nr:XRE family transcriptional regulator [Clostridiaceae bacterium]